MTADDLIVLEGRAKRATAPNGPLSTSTLDGDRTFRDHARADVLRLANELRGAWLRNQTSRGALIVAARMIVEYAELYGSLDESAVSRESGLGCVAVALGYDGPLDGAAVKEFLRRQR